MSTLVINFVTLSSKSPTAILTFEWLLTSVSPQMMPQACPLREVSVTPLDSALVHLSLFVCSVGVTTLDFRVNA